MEQLLTIWQIFILGLGRVATFIMLTPILGSMSVPRTVKVLVAIVLTAFCLHVPATAWGTGTPLRISTAVFSLLLVKEMAVGFLLAFTLVVLFGAFEAAGELIGFQMTLSSSVTFLPSSQNRSTVTGSFMYIFALLVFITINGHHWLIQALDQSFRTLPVLTLPSSLGPFPLWMHFFGQWMAIALKLALPLLATLFITNLMLGMVARTMPQINIFVVGMPVQIIAGLLVLSMMVNSLFTAEAGLFRDWARNLSTLMHWMAA
jgi:flagellar biosynthetic protein FliR